MPPDGIGWLIRVSNTMRIFINRAIGLLLGVVLIAVFVWFVHALLQVDDDTRSIILAFVGSVILAVFAHVFTKRREVEARHFEAKSKGYEKLVGLMIDMLTAVALGQGPLSDRKMITTIKEFKIVLLVWSSRDVLNAWESFEMNAASGSHENTLLLVDDLIRALRKDLGKDDSRLPRGALVATMLKADEKDKMLA